MNARDLRLADARHRGQELSVEEAKKLYRRQVRYEVTTADSEGEWFHTPIDIWGSAAAALWFGLKYEKEPEAGGDGLLQFARKKEPRGPLAVFGYDYFAEHAKAAGMATPKLLSYEGLWGAGEEYSYEVLNFADGKRDAQEIRDAVSAEYGPVPVEMVVEYLKALEKIGVVEQVK